MYVPLDSASLSLGAEDVAESIARSAAERGHDVRIVRNGSRGMFWLEPLVEVETPQGRVAYGPVTPDDVPALFDARVRGPVPTQRCPRGGPCSVVPASSEVAIDGTCTR